MGRDDRDEEWRQHLRGQGAERWRRLQEDFEQWRHRQEERESQRERQEEPREARRPRNAEHTQEALLDAAEALFAEHGFEGARMDEIARRARYNIALLFRYFQNKDGLYRAVIGRVQQQENDELVGMLAPFLEEEKAGLSHDLVRRFIEAWVAWFLQMFARHPQLVRLLSWEMSTGWKMLAQAAPPAEYQANLVALAFLERAQQAGLLRATLSVRTIFASMFSLCLLLTLPRSRFLSAEMSGVVVPEEVKMFLDLETLRQQITEQVLYGVFPTQEKVSDESRTSE